MHGALDYIVRPFVTRSLSEASIVEKDMRAHIAS